MEKTLLNETAIQPKELQIFYHPKDRLRMTVPNDRSYPTVKPAWSAPLSRPGKYLALLNGKGEEIATIVDPKELPDDSRTAVEEELRRRYLTATVHRVTHAKGEFGSTYWHVVTDRGERDFVTQSLQENAQWLGPTHLMLIDVDGNRFEIVDTKSLDEKSQAFIEAML
ncbi:MAG: hypothetical protein BGO01_16730 [Armatimonadetes bacterium 55-13]|nr:DUF1854 domain-containing protein [Armatimonadota bacterium]OJU65502.1 MAG: hypothetical protein BGO01_16730 [Armatimonadetes bacterium 55-13]